mgnify:CR=1 FL=1
MERNKQIDIEDFAYYGQTSCDVVLTFLDGPVRKATLSEMQPYTAMVDDHGVLTVTFTAVE